MKKLNGKKIQLLIWLGVLVAVIGLSVTANHFLNENTNDESSEISKSLTEDVLKTSESAMPQEESSNTDSNKEPTEQTPSFDEDNQMMEEKSQKDPGPVLPDVSKSINKKTNDANQAAVQEPIEEFPQKKSTEERTLEPVKDSGETVEKPVNTKIKAVEYTPQNPNSQKFPEFTLNDLNGSPVSLEDFRGKVVVLNFWASWCPPCRSEMPELQSLDNDFKKGENAVFLAINLADGVRETEEKAAKFLKDNAYTFTNLIDEDTTFSGSLGITSIPTTIIIDRAGHLYDYILGATTKSRIIASVKEVV